MRPLCHHCRCFPPLCSLPGAGRQEAATAQRPPSRPRSSPRSSRWAPQPFLATVPVTGTLVSNTRVDVKAEIIGRVVRFDKEEGDPVAAGEAVAWVDDENYQLAVRQAETSVQVAEAGLERARLMEAHSRSELERAQNLLKSGGITDKDVKAAQLAGRDAQAQVLVADAQLEQARAALEVARKHLRDTEIKAPVAGEIQRKFVNKGAYVEAPTPGVHASWITAAWSSKARWPRRDLAPIRSGQARHLPRQQLPRREFRGPRDRDPPAVDAETRSAKVRIQVDNAAGRLKAGMFAEGEILTGVNAGAIVIPGAAVYRDDRSAKSSHVFVLENGKAVPIPVRGLHPHRWPQ